MKKIVICGVMCLFSFLVMADVPSQYKQRLVEQQKVLDEKKQKENEQKELERKSKIEEKRKSFKNNESEGYDSFSWDTSLSDIMLIYPNAKLSEHNDYIKKLERKGSSSDATLTYYFYDDKLYMGQTVYLDINTDLVNMVASKLLNIYGKQDEQKDINDSGKTYYSMYEKSIREEYGKYNDYYLWKKTGWAVYWHKSSTFLIELSGIDTYTADYEYYDYTLNDNSLSITYENPKKVTEIENRKQKDKDEELKKKMENLDL